MKKVIILAIIVVTLAILYYFIFFLPSQKLIQIKQEKQAFLFNKQTECKNICENIYQSEKKLFLDNMTLFNPQYAYNKLKNTCFYSGGWINTNPSGVTRRIVNCQTNEEVLTLMTSDDKVLTFCSTCVSSSEEYEIKSKEYMEN